MWLRSGRWAESVGMASLDAGPAGAGKVKVQKAKFKGKAGASRRASAHPCQAQHPPARPLPAPSAKNQAKLHLSQSPGSSPDEAATAWSANSWPIVEAWHPLPGAALRFRLRFLTTLRLRLRAGSGLPSAALLAFFILAFVVIGGLLYLRCAFSPLDSPPREWEQARERLFIIYRDCFLQGRPPER